MALAWADLPSGQLGLYSGIDDMLDGIWAQHENSSSVSIGYVSDPDPNIGSAGRVLFFTTSNILPGFSRIVNPNGAQATSGIGFRLWQDQLPYSDTQCKPQWGFRDSTNQWIVGFQVNPDGSISAYRSIGGPEVEISGGTLIATTTPVLTAEAYAHIECKVLRDASAGTCEIRVNGVEVMNETSLALGANNISMAAIGCSDSVAVSGLPNTRAYYKDFFYWDGSGSNVNDFQGSVSVRHLIPDGDQSLNWTPSTGSTGYDLIDETGGPNDADYIEADSTPPAANIVTMSNLPDDVTSVRALIAVGRMQKNDGGDCKIQMALSPNGTNWDSGTDRQITPAFTYWFDVSHVSPATASAWTPAETNAAQFRVDRTL